MYSFLYSNINTNKHAKVIFKSQIWYFPVFIIPVILFQFHELATSTKKVSCIFRPWLSLLLLMYVLHNFRTETPILIIVCFYWKGEFSCDLIIRLIRIQNWLFYLSLCAQTFIKINEIPRNLDILLKTVVLFYILKYALFCRRFANLKNFTP